MSTQNGTLTEEQKLAKLHADPGYIYMQNVIDSNRAKFQRSQESLVAQGLYDKEGNRLVKGTPFDMRSDSGCDVG